MILTFSFVHPSFNTLVFSFSSEFPFCRSSAYHFHEIPKLSNTLAKNAFSPRFPDLENGTPDPPLSKACKTVQTPNPIKTDALHTVIKCLWFLPPWERGMKTCQRTWCVARWDGLYDGAWWLRHGGGGSSVDVRRRDILHHLDADQGVWAIGLGLHCDQVHQQVWNKAHAAASEHK